MQRKASAVWQGDLKSGKGSISTDSGTLRNAQYSFSTRFENGVGTNPEELLAAAHAGCFTMALSAQLGGAGLIPTKLETTCTISLEKVGEGFSITKSHLDLVAHVPNADKDRFDAAVKAADTGQPVSAALTAASNLSLSAFGTCATRSRWLLVMEKPSPTFSSEIVQVVSSFVGIRPAPPSCADSAMVKQPACAAARSSSGLVPTPFSKRVLNEYCAFLSVPLSVEILPLPDFKSPCQTADALRCMNESPVSHVSRSRNMEIGCASRGRVTWGEKGFYHLWKIKNAPRAIETNPTP